MNQFGKEYTHQDFGKLFNDCFSNNKDFSVVFNLRAAWEKVYDDLVWRKPCCTRGCTSFNE